MYGDGPEIMDMQARGFVRYVQGDIGRRTDKKTQGFVPETVHTGAEYGKS